METFFNPNFYPTPVEVIEQMTEGYDFTGKFVLEPSAGKGNIVDYLKEQGAQVIACELNPDLRTIVAGKCPVIADDFLKVKPEQVSHINFIVMNPPFSADEKHILQAWDIAPPGCTILSLCNSSTVDAHYSYKSNERIRQIVEENGVAVSLGECFSDAERKTDVSVTLLRLQKPGATQNEFEGFFMGADAPEGGNQEGLMSYNYVRDIVNRYITALKIYDEQLEAAVRMNEAISTFKTYDYDNVLNKDIKFMAMDEKGKPIARNEFKKALQKSAWQFVIKEAGLRKYSTSQLEGQINKFVETQTQIPFTMRNIYRMLQIIVGTTSQRMDSSLLLVFDKLTQYYDENRYCLEGWKTNSHYLINEKFILPYMVESRWGEGKMTERMGNSSYFDNITDLEKALCYVTGTNYDEVADNGVKGLFWRFNGRGNGLSFGQWYETWFFEIKGFKKGSMHFKFKDKKVWELFNRKVAELKGYPLPEAKEATSHKEKQEQARRDQETGKHYRPDVTTEPEAENINGQFLLLTA